jgi:hypothetical protein
MLQSTRHTISRLRSVTAIFSSNCSTDQGPLRAVFSINMPQSNAYSNVAVNGTTRYGIYLFTSRPNTNTPKAHLTIRTAGNSPPTMQNNLADVSNHSWKIMDSNPQAPHPIRNYATRKSCKQQDNEWQANSLNSTKLSTRRQMSERRCL